MNPLGPTQSLSDAARRMRLYRERRRRGLSCIKVQLRRSEVDGLVACKLLEPTEREDRGALAAALHRYLDANPIAARQMVTRNDERVTCHLLELDQRDRHFGAPAGRKHEQTRR